MAFGDVLHAWQNNTAFRSFFIELLAASPFADFRWECPPITAESVNRPFEFVLVDSPGLAPVPEPEAFASHFAEASLNPGVVSFKNVGGDAVLVVPCPLSSPMAYRHLGAFLREAPEEQKHSLWAVVGETVEQVLEADPLWLSTAGAGVSWLHVRIDQRPKYYAYEPYRRR